MVTFRHTVLFVNQFSQTLGQLNNGLRAVQSAAGGIAPSAAAASAALGGLSVSVGLGAVGFAVAAKNAADLEDNMARLATVTYSESQSIGTSLKNAEAAAREFSNQFTASTADVIHAQFELAEAGVPVVEQIHAVQAAFKLARGAQGEFGEATKLLGTFLNTFGRDVEHSVLDPFTKVQKLTDALAVTVQRFQVTLPVLAEGFKFITGPANQLGLKFEEVATALGILNTAGFRGTLAGTALSNTFNKMERAIEKLDLDPEKFTDVEGNIKSLASFIREVGVALEDKGPLQGQIDLINVFDIRAGRIIKTLINTVDQLERMTAELNVSQGATDEMAATLEKTTNAQFKKFANTIENISTSIGKTFNDTLRPAVAGLNLFGSSLQKFVEDNRNVVTGVSLLVAAIGTLGVVLVATRPLIAAMNGSLQALTASLIGAQAAGALFGKFVGLLLVGGGVAVAATTLVALTAAIYGVSGAADEAISRQQLLNKAMSDAVNSNKNQIDSLQKLASEYKALGNAINFPNLSIGSRTREIGTSFLAKRVQELRREFGASKTDAVIIRIAFDEGTFDKDVKAFADRFNLTTEAVNETINSLTLLTGELDSTFSKLNKVEQVSKIFSVLAAGARAALSSIAGGDEQLIAGLSTALTALQGITTVTEKLTQATKELAATSSGIRVGFGGGPQDIIKAFADVISPTERGKAIEKVSVAVENLRTNEQKLVEAFISNEQAVQRSTELTEEFKQEVLAAAKAVGQLEGDFQSFLKTPQGQTFLKNATDVTKGIQENVSAIQLFQATVEHTGEQVQRLFNIQVTAIESVSKALKAYEGGGLTLEQFQKKATSGFTRLNDVLEKLPGLLATSKAELAKLETLGPRARESAEIVRKRIEQIEENIPELTAQIKIDKFNVDKARMFAALTGITGELSHGLQTSIEGIASKFSDTLFESLKSGNIINVADDMARTLRTTFARSFTDILTLGPAGPIGKALEQIKVEFSKKLEIDPTLAFDIPRAKATFQNLFETLFPEQAKFAKVPLFEDLDAKSATFKEIASTIAKIQTLQLTTDNATQVKLDQLRERLGTKPIDFLGIDELESKIPQISELLVGASKDAQGAITSVLEKLFERFNELKLPTAAGDNLTTVSAGVADTLTTAANTLQSGLESGARAINNFVTPAIQALEQLLRTVFQTSGNANSAGGPDKIINNTFNLGAKTFNIPVTVTGTTTGEGNVLEDREIRQIVTEVTKRMETEMRENLRALEQRLREARR